MSGVLRGMDGDSITPSDHPYGIKVYDPNFRFV